MKLCGVLTATKREPNLLHVEAPHENVCNDLAYAAYGEN